MKKERRPRAWNSTAPARNAPLKRTGIKRKLVSRSFGSGTRKPPKQRKPIPKVNKERIAKRQASYRQKLAAYRKSETYKAVEARAGGQCERLITIDVDPFNPQLGQETIRCPATRAAGCRLTHNHLRYTLRFGGAEILSDIEVLCDPHNIEYESQHPTRLHGRKRV